MLLKKIELKGFKSFADRTVVDFGQGITCIVGPNGSGKSNVTDAFRWVLGEQRFKTLRGNQMLDVIFNGTTKRKALGFAEVAITFDNTEGYLPVAFSEVTVVRRLFRSGESEYAINGTKCRLKDVKELFMDTGVGVEGYSIIGQGRIESILSTNKEERRLILEEAAGIVKYRTRKEEAQRKLDRTALNLERIEDIVKELSERVGPLKEQAEKAKEFLAHSEALKDLEINLFIHEVEQVDDNLKILMSELEDKEKQNHTLKNQLETHLDTLADLEQQLLERGAKEKQLASEQQQALADVTRHKHEIELAKERHVLIEGNIAQLKRQTQEDQEQRLLIEETLERERLAIADETEAYTQRHSALVEGQGHLDALAEQVFEITSQIERLQTEGEAIKGQLTQEQMLKEKLQLQMNHFNDRLVSLNQEAAVFDESQSAAIQQLSQAQKEVETCDLELRDIETKRIQLQADQQGLQKELAGIEERIYEKRAYLTSISAKQAALIEQENQQEGFSYAVKQVLDWSKGDTDVLGCIKDLFTVDKKFEVAVETALGRHLQSIVVAHENAVDQYIEALKHNRAGRATFMPLKGLEPREVPAPDSREGYFGCAVHHVQASSEVMPAMQYILSNVYFAHGLGDAKKAARHLPKGSRVVTLEGEIVNVGGTVTGGSLSKKETGFLKRKREIQELETTIAAITQEIGILQEERTRLQEAMLACRKAFDATESHMGLQKQSLNDAKLKLDQVRQNISAASQGKGRLNQSVKSLSEQIEALEEEIEVAQENHKVIRGRLEEVLVLVEDKKSLHKQLQADFESAQSGLVQLKIDDARAKEVLTNLERNFTERQARYEQMEKQAQRRVNDCDVLEQTLIELEETVKRKQVLVEEANAGLLALEEAYVNEQRLVEGLRTQMQGIAIEVENYRNQVGSFNDAIFRLEIDKTKLETRKDNILQNLFEKYELTYAEAALCKHEFDLKAYASEARRLKAIIKGLGDVNIGAIKEFDIVNERYEFLSAQKEDLNEAKAQLSKLIKEMDKEMRQSFKEKLEEINAFFKETFSSLFGGGFGEITAEGHEDILEAEIVIHAQPPGKKLQSLDLMSGGEKALTAIALLFAILKTKPSPFCILDEIEAALDDVNIFRFASFLKDYVQNSQFIIITHRKGTMEIAQSLYGVTMQEQGISTVISVQLGDDYDRILGDEKGV